MADRRRGPVETRHNTIDAAENPMDQIKDKLDALWVEYLDLLHQYDNAQRELAKHMSSVSSNQS